MAKKCGSHPSLQKRLVDVQGAFIDMLSESSGKRIFICLHFLYLLLLLFYFFSSSSSSSSSSASFFFFPLIFVGTCKKGP